MSEDAPRPKLVRPKHERVLTGVSAGLAEHLGLPVFWVRIGFAILTLMGGAGAILYFFLLATVPSEGEETSILPLKKVFTQPSRAAETLSPAGQSSQARRLPTAEILLGGALLIAGGTLIAAQLGVGVRVDVILPALAVLVGVGLTWWLIADREHPEKNFLPRVLAALALVAVGVLTFFVTANDPNIFTVISAAVAVLAGVGFAIAPWLLRLNRELVLERAARAREAERSEIAAHLHDSVLQTLALIQQRSDPASEVSRIARGQERELREWLFRTADTGAGADSSRGTIKDELAKHAAALEEQHPVRFEVVSVGERAEAPEAILAAAREAMLNAARHAGGDVMVYIETTKDHITVDINDRGMGFDAANISESRFGVRESILGRMERAGGSAKISKGPGGTGASVQLTQSREAGGAGANE